MPSSRGSSQPKDQTRVSCITGGFFTAKLGGKPPGKTKPLPRLSFFSSLDVIFSVPMQFQVKGASSKHFLPTSAPD